MLSSLISTLVIGIPRARGIGVLDVTNYFGPTARAWVETGRPCPDFPLATLQIEEVGTQTLRMCALRRPFIPALLASASLFTDAATSLFVVKALVSSALLGLSFWWAVRGQSARGRLPLLVFGFVASLNPSLMSQMAGIETEEAYAIPMLAVLTGLWLDRATLRARWAQALALALIVSLLLIKSSYVFGCLTLVACLAKAVPRPRDFLAVGLTLAVSVILGLGAFAKVESGRFATQSSIDWWNARKGNSDTTDTFLHRSQLDFLRLPPVPPSATEGEWAFDDHYKRETLAFWAADPWRFVRMTARRAFEYFVRVDFVSGNSSGAIAGLLWLTANVLLRVFLLGSLAAAALAWVRPSVAQPPGTRPLAAGWIVLVGAFAAPHMLGFAYLRHVVMLAIPAAFVLARLLDREPSAPR